MGKVIKINGAGAKEESLKEISENLHMLKRTLVGVVAEYEENEAEEKKDEENAINTDLFQPAYTVNSHKKKLTAVEGLVSGVVERVQK